ncbi:RagB/SusD family nutrient uptake outer membrane protein [Chitinophaga tropicalis]|nr:RagB/SusD family nutrient uptake outer membrane protein [Chitinophaga tropicalis]
MRLKYNGMTRLQKIVPVLIVLAVSTLATGCRKDFLDREKLSVLNEEAIFSDSVYAIQYVNTRYSNLTYSWDPNRFGSGGLECAIDEAESALAPTGLQNIISGGALNPSNTDKNIWSTTYAQVRAINIFLRNRPVIPLSVENKMRCEGQLRFLRAWYYFTMLKHFGGFPIVGDTVFNETDKIDVPRSSYEECVNYIAAECDKAAGMLPLSYPNTTFPGEEYGRVTKGAALALKARALLYAASPLTNTQRADDPDHLVSYGNTDPDRWRIAAEANKAVIDMNAYSLYRGSTPFFYNLFLVYQPNDALPEQIFAYQTPSSERNSMLRETIMNPPSRGTRYIGTVSVFPLQELVDAFGMKNGLPITDPASGYSGIGDDMYKNRDPRFYYTVTFNGALRAFSGFSGDQPVRTYTGVIPAGNANETSANLDGIYKNNATRTGYYCYKMLSNTVIGGGSLLMRPGILIRYAEILLNAAEAYNEAYGPSEQIIGWLKDIRNRAGIEPGVDNMYGIRAGMNKEEMRAFIQAERRVELAFEEHRFWDVRRWKIASETENRDMHGMEITRAANGVFSYRLIVVRSHVFRDEMYFFPVPQTELTKSPSLKQNPGY